MLFGNVIGSNIANILVILGLAVLIVPFQICNDVIKKEIPILLLVTLGLSTLFLDNLFDPSRANSLTRADGVTLILFFSIFVYYLITLLSDGKNKNANETPRYKTLKSVIIIALGLTGVILGSGLVVDNVAAFAERIGISQKIISVTIISIGTSLPELVTTVMAAKKGENNMAIGNIVGSNIFNACIVLGLPVIVLGEAATAAFNAVDMTFMSLSVVLLWIFSSTNRKLKRYEAVIFMLVYCGYGGYILMQ
jgi:cation:H+ antiporter